MLIHLSITRGNDKSKDEQVKGTDETDVNYCGRASENEVNITIKVKPKLKQKNNQGKM